MDIVAWQARFYAGPKIWATMYRDADGLEDPANFYESEEAARLEVEWAKRHEHRTPSVVPLHIHTLALARERWTSGAA